MSIDTLLEAARYLEWRAQQHQITRGEESQCKQKELFVREAESRRSEVVTPSAQTGGANHHHHHHVARGNEPRPPQTIHVPAVGPPPPPPPSLPPARVPVAIVPVVPVVTPTRPAAPAVVAPAAAAIAVATPTLNGSSPPHRHLRLPPPPTRTAPPRPPLPAPPVQAEQPAPPQQNGAGPPAPSQPPPLQPPPLQAPAYPPSFGAAAVSGAASPHAATPQLSPDTDDMRGGDGKRRPGGAGTREVHNKLEKNRRAHLKECFETLKKNVPNVDEKKTSNLSVLRGALRYIQTLKRKEKEYEHEMERLAREKISVQQRLAELKDELSASMDAAEVERVLRQTVQPEDDQVSTSTASEGEEDPDRDLDDEGVPAPSPAEPLPAAPPPAAQAPPLLALRQHAALPFSGRPAAPPPGGEGPAARPGAPPPQAIAPAPPRAVVAPRPLQPTVIAHAAVSHPSVIQAVRHAPPPANHKHLTHIAPSPGPASPAAAGSRVARPVGHITVHPVTRLYPRPAVAVSQPAAVGHIAHAFARRRPHAPADAHAAANGVQVNGAAAAAAAPHPQLVAQTTVLNPVTLVNVPVGTLKLA